VSIALPPMNGSQPAAGETQVGQQLIDASMQTALSMVQKMRMLDSGAEAKDFGDAVLKLSQVIALLDPTRDTQGVPLDHQLEMQKQKGQQELEKVKEQSKASAQTPTKSVSVARDKNGRATNYQVKG
jgi:hypothetical protein